jgi:pimeloyl-ACP methyl ester carboxylesterase
MPTRLLRTSVAATLLASVLSVSQAPAANALGFAPCVTIPGFSCATLQVPISRMAGPPGAISLHLARKLSGGAPSHDALLALAGGPGQAALPLASYFEHDMSTALRTRDLLVFDQRGTGESDPLDCSVLEASGLTSAIRTVSQLFEQCALQIGARGSYTTAESVADIEAIRMATGYSKLTLYGTSYGTKVALQYAERYPQHVEALVLDSVVPPEGPEPFGVPSLQAIGPMLQELCSDHACAGIASKPLGEVASLASRLHGHALVGSVYDGSGHRHMGSLGESGLLDILEAGDLNPTLRAMLPSAVSSALRNDPDPLLRLKLLSEGLIPNLPGSAPASFPSFAPSNLPPSARASVGSDSVDEALFITTTCEETRFPWQRSSPPSVRLKEALAALHALPSSDFYPFNAATAWRNSLVGDCVQWPFASSGPQPVGTLPDVPTLILSGAQDLRTPPSYAQRVAREIPDAHLVIVPYAGHSVLGSDFSGCAMNAVNAFFEGTAVHPCATSTDEFSPTPLSPTSLSHVRPMTGLQGRPARTLTAVLETMTDLARQVIGAALEANQRLPSGSSFGGLRGGYARISSSAVRLARFSFVPGVQISGSFPIRNGKLQPATVSVLGANAAHGSVRLAAGERVAGTLGDRRFDLNVARAKLSLGG